MTRITVTTTICFGLVAAIGVAVAQNTPRGAGDQASDAGDPGGGYFYVGYGGAADEKAAGGSPVAVDAVVPGSHPVVGLPVGAIDRAQQRALVPDHNAAVHLTTDDARLTANEIRLHLEDSKNLYGPDQPLIDRHENMLRRVAQLEEPRTEAPVMQQLLQPIVGSPREKTVQSLLEKWKGTKAEAERSAIKEELRDVLKEKFKAQLAKHQLEVERLVEKVHALREQLDRRREKQQEIIDFRLEQLLRDAQGLGWTPDQESRTSETARDWLRSSSASGREATSREPPVEAERQVEMRRAFVSRFPHTITAYVRTQQPNPEIPLQQFVDISPDEQFAATVQNADVGWRNKSYSFVLWEHDSGRPIRKTERPGTAATVRFAESGRIVGVHKVLENVIDLFQVPSGRFVKALEFPPSRPWREALQEYAAASPVWLGVGMHGGQGEVRIMSVRPGTGAEKAGLREGDRILALDGHKVSDIQEVADRTMWRKPGEEATLKVLRGDEVLTVKVELMTFRTSNGQGYGTAKADDTTAQLDIRSWANSDESPIDKSALDRVSKQFSHETRLAKGLVTSGGVIERIEQDTIHLTSGDSVVVGEEALITMRTRSERPVSLMLAWLEPGMAITYSIKDGKVQRVHLAGIVEPEPNRDDPFERIKELQLRKAGQITDSLDGRHPIRMVGSEGEVLVKLGETKLISLPQPTTHVEWRTGEINPETIDDVEPFDHVLVQWRDNGRVTWTFYQPPPNSGE